MDTALTHIKTVLASIKQEMQKEIIGQDTLIQTLLIGLMSHGHILLEGVPGLGKTQIVKTLAHVLGHDFKRISFTPDLLPSDLIGNEIYRPQTSQFEVRKGPIFTDLLLADEINRTPPKVQSALLEAMEERQVTIGDQTLPLSELFFVIATQNPLEHEGTYPLPEAELDRFMMKVVLSYPNPTNEEYIIKNRTSGIQDAVASSLQIKTEDIEEMGRYIAEHIHIENTLYSYVIRILTYLRSMSEGEHALLEYGPSTRAGIALVRGAKVRALLHNRDYVIPEDIKSLAPLILTHRIGLSYEAKQNKKTGADLVEEALLSVSLP